MKNIIIALFSLTVVATSVVALFKLGDGIKKDQLMNYSNPTMANISIYPNQAPKNNLPSVKPPASDYTYNKNLTAPLITSDGTSWNKKANTPSSSALPESLNFGSSYSTSVKTDDKKSSSFSSGGGGSYIALGYTKTSGGSNTSVPFSGNYANNLAHISLKSGNGSLPIGIYGNGETGNEDPSDDVISSINPGDDEALTPVGGGIGFLLVLSGIFFALRFRKTILK